MQTIVPPQSQNPGRHTGSIRCGSRYAENHLDKQRSQMVMSFYRGIKMFRDSFDEEGKSHLTFHKLDNLIETYFRPVKDLSRHLFRDTKNSNYATLLQVIFDLSFGIVFHVMLKFKETLRLAENYNIDKLARIVDKIQHKADSEVASISRLFNSLRVGYEHDLAALEIDLRRARDMLGELEQIFSKIISVYNDNVVILRSIYANHSFFRRLFPDEGVDRVFIHMFPETGPADAYMLLGFDFIRTGHLTLAERAFRRAEKCQDSQSCGCPTCEEIGRYYQARRRQYLEGLTPEEPAHKRLIEDLEAFEKKRLSDSFIPFLPAGHS